MDVQARLAQASNISDIVRVWAECAGTSPALRDPQWQLTYAELWRAIEGAARRLAVEGVARGDRVMLVAENCIPQVVLTFACVVLGAWPVNVNARLSPREIESIRMHCRPRLMAFSSSVSPDAEAHASRQGALPWRGDALFEGFSLIAAVGDVPREDVELANDVAALVYTSGTTGAPKGVMVRHHGLLHFARVSCASRSLGPTDKVYGVLPLPHIFGFATILLTTLYAGACLVLERKFTPERLVETLVGEGITTFQGVPTLFTRVIEHLKLTGLRMPRTNLRYLYSGGASLDLAVKREVEAVFGLPLHQGYGMTEYAGSMFITRTDAPRGDDSSGYRNEGVEIRLLDDGGNEVGLGQVGSIQIRGPGVMRGYYRNPEGTSEVLSADGWLATGDLGRLDPDGALFIVGRTKDLIIRSGFNVYPVEVESVLNAWPGIQLSAVVGHARSGGDEEVVAFVELQAGRRLVMAELQAYLARELAPYKRPSRVVILHRMPVTFNGKLQKMQLREWLLHGGAEEGTISEVSD
ncbi:class I adenylate-forming enzyme family protein [Pseudomonas citronellolis]|uniref:class I adenylate-forming enzyme family protein n=1 Tax=Pseudomonas citronellolis TaxID=53408 RepID=UPI0021C08D88|nr:class I adenylate-forming enzyme family protein [Pseudomonas citronellolis]UXJ50280.1 acyl--CoA ligase [Pseudomonas citronellolis]